MSTSSAPPAWFAALREQLGPTQVSLRSEDLVTYARDLCPRGLLAIAGAQSPPTHPAAVVWPQSAAEVQTVLRLCRQYGVALVPFGAGSGVAGGAVGPAGSLVLDTKRMRAVQIDADRGVVSFEPGILGWHLEEKLNRQGLSLGHFPSSIMCSTAGGWLATRSAGQMSTKYGKIEDLVRSLEVCTGDGERRQLENGDRGGTDWVQLLVGSEGTLGVITRATCAIRPMPKSRRMRGFRFPSLAQACQAIQQLLQMGMRPAVLRLYDELDTLISGIGRHGGGRLPDAAELLSEDEPGRLDIEHLLRLLRKDAQKLKGRLERWLVRTLLGETTALNALIEKLLGRFGQGCRLIVGFEGETATTAAEDALARDWLLRSGGLDLGEEPGQHWLRHRYDVSFKMSKAFMAGGFIDTIEVACTWERLLPLYHEVRAALAPYAICMAHFSHAYVDGCSIYFSILARRNTDSASTPAENRVAVALDEQCYDALWQAAMQATLRRGGTISHHHGVGRLKTPFLVGEHGSSLRILSALRTACDPDGICNPGNLSVATQKLPPSDAKPFAPSAAPESSFLVEISGETRLLEVEQKLRAQELSLGGLPPWAWERSLSEALLAPCPSEASLENGRLRDRRAQVRASLQDKSELCVPPQIVPRRATGPDLGQALLGNSTPALTATLSAATLRLCRRPVAVSWTGYLFAHTGSAVRALFAARNLHGAGGIAEVVLTNRSLLNRLLGLETLAPAESWALLVRPAGPESVATAAQLELEGYLASEFCGRLPAEKCRDFWEPFGESASALPQSAYTAARAKHFPAHKTAVALVHSSPAALTTLIDKVDGACLVCGVYLHGMTLCTDSPFLQPSAEAEAKGAEVSLWPRLVAALEGKHAQP